MHTPIPDLYQVKWLQDGCWRYGIVSRWDKRSIAHYNEDRSVVVDDAVVPGADRVKVHDLVPIRMSYDPPDEYQQYVNAEYEAAKRLSDSLPGGVHVGKLFRVPAGDGYAYYVVTKVNKKTVIVEWRGFSIDRWTDFKFGGGGREDRAFIERLINREEAMHKLFAGR